MAMTPIAAATPSAAPAPGIPNASFGAALRAHLRSAPVPVRPPTSRPAAAWNALASIERARSRLDRALAAARAGRTFKPQELLALQADAYRYSQTVELASRLVESGTQSIRQAVNTQV